MTRSEAIEHMKNIAIYSVQDGYTDEARQALDMAIRALEEPELKDDVIYKQEAIDTLTRLEPSFRGSVLEQALKNMPSAQPEEVIPHRNYKYLSDYWCECGWHLGKKGEVKYCSECGRKVNWGE